MLAADALPAWAWLTIGLVLVIGEVLATYFVLIWFGVAALAVGLLGWLMPGLDLVGQVVAFGVLSALLLVPARRLRGHWQRGGRATQINDRAAQQVGRIVTLQEPIAGGHGRVFIGDTLWHVEGPDLPAGARIHVVSFLDATLLVEPAE
jgi:membrane protein implicated in regulation of membrane protease activity